MTRKTLLIFLLVFTVALQSLAQSSISTNLTFKGAVIDKASKKTLSYVSIGVIDKPIGTVSDTSGHFTLNIGKENLKDTMRVSIVGYFETKISIKDFLSQSDNTIKLSAKTEQLAEVQINDLPQQVNTETIGRMAVSTLVQISIHNKKTVNETIGSEMGMIYKTNKKEAVLKDFNFYISANNFDFIKFRVNVYSVLNGLPDTLMYNKQIFATLNNFKTGWNRINLEQYHIKVNKEFIITVQWIDSRMDKRENPVTVIPVAVTLFSKNLYARVASQDKWKRMGMELSSFVTIGY